MTLEGRFALAVALCLMARPVAAQTERMSGPFSGLFGGEGRATNGQSLDLRASLYGVQQKTNVPSDVDLTLLDPRFQSSNRLATATGSLDYSFGRKADNTAVSGGADATFLDYSTRPEDPVYALGANGALSTKLTRRISFGSQARTSYGSTYNFASLSGSTDPYSQSLGLDFAPYAFRNLTSSADINLVATLSQRTTLSASLFANRIDFLDQSSRDFTGVGSGLTLSHRIFRKLAFRASYRREQSFSGDGRNNPPTQSIELALDYGDALTLRLSRRTVLSLGVSAGSARTLEGDTRYRLLGNASLSHSMGRSWSSTAAYARTLGFVSAFREPVLQDSVTASIGGQLKQRVSLTARAAILRGNVGLAANSSFDSDSAVAVMSVALSRRISAFASLSYYRTVVPENLSTLPLLPDLSRRAAVVGISLWAPLYTKPRVRR